jgi:hypothetical protein
MNRKFWFLTLILALVVLVVSACASMIPDTGLTQDDLVATQNAVIVQAAQATATTMALQEQIAQLQTQVAEATANPVVVTATPEPATPTPEIPTATPTVTPIPATPTPTIPCNAAQFVADVSIADGSVLSPGAHFTKTWRLRNAGLCNWSSAYDLIFVSGDSLGGPAIVPLRADVAPGQYVDLSVDLVAPNSEGGYRGYWMLRDGFGNTFGVGSSNQTFYVDILVAEPRSDYPLDFISSYCQAEWSSGAGRIPCSGEDADSRGFVRRVDRPALESGYIDDEPVLLTFPQGINDGVIRGKYPPLRVEQGSHFTAVIGCAYKAEGCDVKFQLDFQVDNGSIQTLATWHEVYDEEFNLVDVDLSGLAGNDVRFILTVLSNGSPHQDRAYWLAPRIRKE